MTETKVPVPTALGIGGPLIQITSSRGGRYYELSHFTGQPRVPSVTSILDGTLRNYGLEAWRQQHIERGLEAHRGKTLSAEAIDRIMGASAAEAQASADLGITMHSIIDGLLQGQEVAVPTQLEPAVQGFLRWRTRFSHWELQGSEVTVYDEVLGYAGTVDALWYDTENEHCIVVDWKTSAGLYASALMQVSAYAHALEKMLHGQGILHLGTNVRGMVVRFGNGYPQVRGQKDRSQPKLFTSSVEYAWSDNAQWEAFETCLRLSKANKGRIVTETL